MRDYGGHRHHRIDRRYRTRDGRAAASRRAPRPGSHTQSGAGRNPLRRQWVATSLWWLATWRGLMTSVDWPTRPASTARSTRGAQRGRMGAGQQAADLGGRSRDDLCGERLGAAPTDPRAVRRAAGTVALAGLGPGGVRTPAARGPWPGDRSAAGVRREQGMRCCPGPGLESSVAGRHLGGRRPGVGQDWQAPAPPATSARPHTIAFCCTAPDLPACQLPTGSSPCTSLSANSSIMVRSYSSIVSILSPWMLQCAHGAE
jgi:hypothetical protein